MNAAADPVSTTPCLDRLIGFGRLLRARGLTVSPAEVTDAARALTLLPAAVGERALFEATLAGTLVKRSVDVAVFREAVASYFFPDDRIGHDRPPDHAHPHAGDGGMVGIDVVARPGATDGGTERHEHGQRIDLRQFFGSGSDARSDGHHPGDRWRLTWLGSEQLLDPVRDPMPSELDSVGAFGLRRVGTVGRPGALRIAGIELPRDVVLRGTAMGDATAEPQDDRAGAAIGWRMPERAPMVSKGSPDRVRPGTEEMRDLPDLRWDALSADDLWRMERAVARLGRRFGGAPSRRRPSARRGRLDARATARRAAATDGLPFAPVFRACREDRPRLIVLCDVSLSVRGAARFLLQVAHAAQRQTGRVRTFVFVREIAEVTAVLGGNDLEAAIAAVFCGRLLDVAEASDAGAALRTFLTRHHRLISPRTTLLVLGDGRNNGRDPGLDALSALRDRCRRVIWLTPEGRGTWRLAGCDLPRYAAFCDIVHSVKTPAALESLVARIAG